MEKERKTTSSEAEDVQKGEERERNLRFYSKGCEVPQDAIKPIRAGRLRGMSDVNPMWRMKRMTEIFGPCGIGWKYVIDRQWTESYGEEVKCFCNILLFVKDPETGEWGDPIPGNGGSSIVSKEKSGLYVNDEGYKMALTDALSIAMKPLGIGANIWYGSNASGHNESKYEAATREGQDYTQSQHADSVAYTDEQLKKATAEMRSANDEQAFQDVWAKWYGECPALCNNGTPFYNVACETITRIKGSEQ